MAVYAIICQGNSQNSYCFMYQDAFGEYRHPIQSGFNYDDDYYLTDEVQRE